MKKTPGGQLTGWPDGDLVNALVGLANTAAAVVRGTITFGALVPLGLASRPERPQVCTKELFKELITASVPSCCTMRSAMIFLWPSV